MLRSTNQQSELWLFLSVTWWIGGLVAWLVAWLYPIQTFNNDSQMTMVGLLVFLVSAVLRLPVLTAYPRTTSMEDHFVWLLMAIANLNWLGFMCLQSPSLTAIFPPAVIGIAIEFWLYHQASQQGTLYRLRANIQRYLEQLGLTGSPALNFISNNESNIIHTDRSRDSRAGGDSELDLTPSHTASSNQSLSEPVINCSKMNHQAVDACSAKETEQSRIVRTVEDGLDATGGRYMAGEIALKWLQGQTTQQVVLGFVPAFQGAPQVELELGDYDSAAQIVQCTPSGLRVQIKRTDNTAESICNLSWYAKQIPLSEQAPTAPAPLP